MFARALTVVLLLAAAAHGELIVTDGDFYDRLRTDQDLRVEGGRVNRLEYSGDSATIDGGSVGKIDWNSRGALTIRGGELSWIPGQLGASVGIWEANAPVLIEGSYFREQTTAANQRKIEGFLADGTFTRLNIAIDATLCHQGCPFSIDYAISGAPLPGDTDGDFDVDLADLNTVRNNFGSPGPGDFDKSGTVDLADLNAARNSFGAGGQFTIPANQSVPEPAGWIIGLVCLVACYGLYCGDGR